MNREQRRKFNQTNKTSLSKEEFTAIEVLQRAKYGSSIFGEMDIPDSFLQLRPEELVPNGTEVKLFYQSILTRPKEDLADSFIVWIENNKDGIFHVAREKAHKFLVCLQEDVLTDAHIPWLFDVYSDLLYFDKITNEWVILEELERRRAFNVDDLKEEKKIVRDFLEKK